MAITHYTSEKNVAQQNEKREAARQACFLPVDYSAQNRVYKDFIQNISAYGAFIESHAAIQAGTRILMTFDLLESNLPIKSKATIVHTVKSGFGVKFDTPITLPDFAISPKTEK